MRIKITYPIITEDFILSAGSVVDVDANQAAKWIENGWACAVEEKDMAKEESNDDEDDRPAKKGKKK